MRDDVFIIWDRVEEKLQELLSHVNGQEKRIQFTMKREERGARFSGPEDGEGGGEGGDRRVS